MVNSTKRKHDVHLIANLLFNLFKSKVQLEMMNAKNPEYFHRYLNFIYLNLLLPILGFRQIEVGF